MMLDARSLLLMALIVTAATSSPLTAPHDVKLHHEGLDGIAPAALSELGSRVAARVAPARPDPRLPLPLPSAADVEAIKKVAQILVLLGEQVIPSLVGQSSGGAAGVTGGCPGGSGGSCDQPPPSWLQVDPPLDLVDDD